VETVKEKIAYLRGMVDSTESFKEEQIRLVFQRMLEVLDELADDVDELYFGQEELDDYIEALDHDLAELEDTLDDDCCGDHDHDDEMVEMECPNCQEMVCFEEDFLYDDDVEITCPECGETLYTSGDLDDLVDDDGEDVE